MALEGYVIAQKKKYLKEVKWDLEVALWTFSSPMGLAH